MDPLPYRFQHSFAEISSNTCKSLTFRMVSTLLYTAGISPAEQLSYFSAIRSRYSSDCSINYLMQTMHSMQFVAIVFAVPDVMAMIDVVVVVSTDVDLGEMNWMWVMMVMDKVVSVGSVKASIDNLHI